MRKIVLFIMTFSILSAYDFGKIPEIRAKDITFGKPMMIMVGKTNCVWCRRVWHPNQRRLKRSIQILLYTI